MNSAFWRGKKVFLTGHTGFKGAWLTRILLDLGADVTGYALPPSTEPNLFSLLGLADKITHIEGDVRDRAGLVKAVYKSSPEIILHLAAQALVRDSYADPLGTFDTNFTGTMNILEAARNCTGLRSFVVITTDKCYLNNETGAFFKEEDKLGGHDPYSASKAAAEIVCHAYYESFLRQLNIPLATARAGNVIGGGDWAKDRLIPDVVRANAEKIPVLIRNPSATRPWQHVLEPLRGYMMLAERLYTDGHAFAGGWNFGPEAAGIQNVGHVLALLKKSFPFDLQLDVAPQPHEAKTLALDVHKAAEKLGWKPLLNLDTAVQWTGEWYKGFVDGASAEETTMRQVKQYFAMAERRAAA